MSCGNGSCTGTTRLGAGFVDSFSDSIETRVSNSSVEAFLQTNASNYDLTVIGASTERSAVSRFVSTPTFKRIHTVDCDLAIVHRGASQIQTWPRK